RREVAAGPVVWDVDGQPAGIAQLPAAAALTPGRSRRRRRRRERPSRPPPVRGQPVIDVSGESLALGTKTLDKLDLLRCPAVAITEPGDAAGGQAGDDDGPGARPRHTNVDGQKIQQAHRDDLFVAGITRGAGV